MTSRPAGVGRICPLDAEWCHADDLLNLANGGES